MKEHEKPLPGDALLRQSSMSLEVDASFLHQRKISISEAAPLIGIGKTKLRELVVAKVIPSIQIDGKYILMEQDLEAYLEGKYSGTILTVIKNKEPKRRLPQEVINSKHLN